MPELKCPNCGSTSQFTVSATTIATVNGDDLSVEGTGDIEWDDDEEFTCCACDHSAPMDDFQEAADAAPTPVR